MKTLEILAYVQCLMMGAHEDLIDWCDSPGRLGAMNDLLDRLERIELYLIRRCNRGEG